MWVRAPLRQAQDRLLRVEPEEARHTTRIRTILMKTRIRARAGKGRAGFRRGGKNLRHRLSLITLSRILRSFLPRAGRSSAFRKRRWKSPPASADFVRGRRCGIRNMAKEPSTSEKEKAK